MTDMISQSMFTVTAAGPVATLSSFLQEGPLPEVCAFDLDYTVWGRDCDKDVIGPFVMAFDGVVYDRNWRVASAFPDVGTIIGALVDAGVKIAFLSRNPSAGAVEQLLRVCPIQSKDPLKRCLWDALSSRAYFHAYSSEGFGRGKDRHFASLRALTGVDFSQIVFFDDLGENVKAAAAQGTTSVQVSMTRGLTWQALQVGIQAWRGSAAAIASTATPATASTATPATATPATPTSTATASTATASTATAIPVSH